MPLTALRRQLQDSRRALLEALQGLTEQDFEAPLEGATVSAYLEIGRASCRERV